MFQKNDKVIYGVHSVCVVEDIVTRIFNDQSQDYYVLRPVFNTRSTVFVPVDSPISASKMFEVLHPDTIFSLLDSFFQEEMDWIENNNQRKLEYKQILGCGDRRQILQLMLSIYRHRDEQQLRGKKLYSNDERTLKEAHRLIEEEFSYVLELQREQVADLLWEKFHLAGIR